MTEVEWLTCADPAEMLIFRFGPFKKLTDETYYSRKNLLLVSACFYRLSDLIPTDLRRWPDHAAQAAEGCYEKQALHRGGRRGRMGIIFNNGTRNGGG